MATKITMKGSALPKCMGSLDVTSAAFAQSASMTHSKLLLSANIQANETVCVFLL